MSALGVRTSRHSFPVRAAGVAALCLASAAAAAGDAVPLFRDDAVLAVRIEAPLETLARERSDTDYLDGVFGYTAADGERRTLDLELRARGRYRRQAETCAFPPVRLNFRKGQVEGTPFEGVDKLKLVTHCENSRSYEQNVLEEYLAYRIFNLLTDESFRVRLLHVDWVNTDHDDEPFTRYAFLIEDDDLLAARLERMRIEVKGTAPGRLAAQRAGRVAVFEYLIGNTDFSMVAGPRDDICCHNIVLFAGDGGLLPVPYDFDFAGLVNARYASPNPRLNIPRVTTRLYRGYCEHNAEVAPSVAEIVSRRPDIDALVDAVPGMDDGTRKKARRYLDGFFRDMAEAKNVDRKLVRKCS